VEISFHILKDQVEVLIILSPNYMMKFDDIRVINLLEKCYLAKGALGISRMLESIENFLES
jgi:hypothetical protein